MNIVQNVATYEIQRKKKLIYAGDYLVKKIKKGKENLLIIKKRKKFFYKKRQGNKICNAVEIFGFL